MSEPTTEERQAEQVLERSDALFRWLGISEISYAEALEAAVAHARRPSPPGDAAWYPIGPRNIGGRITAIAQHPTNALTIYVGSAHGGLWRTIDGGDSWEHLGTAEHNFPVGTIAIPAQSPRTLYLGTGSLHPAYAGGRGFYKVDVPGPTAPAAFDRLAGTPPPTVTPANSTRGAALRYARVEVDPDDPTRFWVASQTGLWRCRVPLAPVPHAPGTDVWVRDLPVPADDFSDGPRFAPSSVPSPGGAWPPFATDVRVARDPRDDEKHNGLARYLVIYAGVDGQGVYRGRYDRKDDSVKWEKKLDIPLTAAEVLPDGNNSSTGIVTATRATAAIVITITTAGAVGTAQFTYQIAGGAVVGPQPTAATFDVPGSPTVTVRFGAGNYVLNDLFTIVPLQRERVRIALCTSQPNHLYVVFASANSLATNVHYSSNHGNDWEMRGRIADSTNGQADYDLVLEVNPFNPDVVICAAVDISKSEDGGKNWTQIADWRFYDKGDHAQHADFHAAAFDVADRRRLWVGNDGGLSVADDLRRINAPAPLTFWRKRSHGILAGQFQHAAVSPVLPFISAGGLQDNGSWASFGGPTWYRIGWADGSQAAFHSANPRIFFPAQNSWANMTSVVPPTNPLFVGSNFPIINSPVVHDVPSGAVPNAMELRLDSFPLPRTGPFVMAVAESPITPGQLLIGAREMAANAALGLPAQRIAYWAPPPPAGPYAAMPAALPAALAVNPPAGAGIAPANVPRGTECWAVAFGPVVPPPPPPAPAPPVAVDGWLGCDNGQLFLSRAAPAGNWAAPGVPLPLPHGIPHTVTRIAVHPDDPRTVAVSAVPKVDVIWLVITTAGAVGAAQFTFQHGLGAATGPIPTAADVVIPTSTVRVAFAGGAFDAGDVFGITPNGDVVPSTNNTGAGTVTARTTMGDTVTVRITVAGAVGVSRFTFQVGTVPASAPQPTAATFVVPGTLLTLRFAPGAYNVGDTWTVSPLGAVAAVAVAGAGVLTANSWVGGRVFVTWNRGVTWTDVTEPNPPAPLTSLPPAAVTSVLWDPRAANPGLYAGTLAGPYVLRNIPIPTGVAIAGGNFNLPATQSRQLVANVALSGVPAPGPDWTQQVDWSTSNAAAVTVNATGRVTAVAAGVSVITAQRGRFTSQITITVVAAAAGAAPPAAGAFAPPAFNPAWAPFNNGFPLTLVNDLTRVTGTNRIRAATFGRGIWECDLGAGAVQRQLYIRQTIIEDGHSYPRTIPMGLRDDPRLPAGPAGVGIDHAHAFDIRVDAPPYRFFEDRADGVEFDEQLGADTVVPGETNYVYVQVHNAGSLPVDAVDVHLFVRAAPAAPPIPGPAIAAVPVPAAPAPIPAVPALGPVAEFYNPPGFALAGGAATWSKIGVRPAGTVAPGAPVVVRFDWVPAAFPAAPNNNAALLAICVAPTDNAGFPAAPADVGPLIAAERRTALRIVPVGPPSPARLHLRDSVVDEGTRRGAGLAAARSPDIMVAQHPLPVPAEQHFRDVLDPRPQDRVRVSADNHVYVRVHNRGKGAGNAEVHVFAIPVAIDGRPDVNTANWQRLTPAAAPFLAVAVPPRSSVLAHVAWGPVTVAVPADAFRQVLVIALIRDTTTGEPLPDVARLRPARDEDLWSMLLRVVDSDNVAARAVRHEP